MSDITIQRDISAPAARAWAVFSEVDRYDEWNPFLVKAVGSPRLRMSLEMTANTPSGGDVRFSPYVIEFDRGKRLVWKTGMSIPGMFSRNVAFEVESTGESSCKFTITIAPRGLLLPLRKNFVSGLEAGYTLMLDALKERAEKLPA